MNYLVFEAGSRAGFSMEMFFRYNRSRGCFLNDTLYMVDDDSSFHNIESVNGVKRIDRKEALLMLKGGTTILPCDELSRQSIEEVQSFANNDKYARIRQDYYDKSYMNDMLKTYIIIPNEDKCAIKIPNTFWCETNVFIRPNKQSAGSKGVMSLSDYCVTEKLDVKKEYVVDVLNHNGFHLFAREVKLKNGYDKYIRILPNDETIVKETAKFVDLINGIEPLFVNGICHIQMCEDARGYLFYIESSKRISGTSIVNLFFGYNPLVLYGGVEAQETAMYERDKWYRYEDFVLGLSKIMQNGK